MVTDRELSVRRQRIGEDALVRGRRGMALKLLRGPRLERAGRVLGQPEGLQDELAGLPVLLAAHVFGAREVERLLGPRHADVEETSLFLEVEVARGQRVLDQARRHLDGIRAAHGGELVLHAVDEEHDGPLEPLGLVHGQHGHGRRVRVRLGHRRVLARVDQRVEVVHELADVVVLQHPGGVPDAREELAHVLHFLLLLGGGLGVAGHQARVDEELVEQLARGRLARQLHVALEVGDEPANRRRALLAHTHLVGHHSEHVEEPAVLAVGISGALGQVEDRHLVDVRRGQVVQAHGIVRMGDRAEKGDEQPDLGPSIQPRVA